MCIPWSIHPNKWNERRVAIQVPTFEHGNGTVWHAHGCGRSERKNLFICKHYVRALWSQTLVWVHTNSFRIVRFCLTNLTGARKWREHLLTLRTVLPHIFIARLLLRMDDFEWVRGSSRFARLATHAVSKPFFSHCCSLLATVPVASRIVQRHWYQLVGSWCTRQSNRHRGFHVSSIIRHLFLLVDY